MAQSSVASCGGMAAGSPAAAASGLGSEAAAAFGLGSVRAGLRLARLLIAMPKQAAGAVLARRNTPIHGF